MPSTISALLILVIAIVPGRFGNSIYTRILGTDWRERETAALARTLAFSVFGLALYALIANALRLPLPIHVLPASYAVALSSAGLTSMAPGYIGHCVAGGLTGGLAAMGTRLLSKLSGGSPHPAAWDDFVKERVGGRWVVAALTSGESYAGILETVDASVDPTSRDVLLSLPAQYDPEREDYIATEYRHLFLKAAQIDSIASLRNSDSDQNLLTRPGEPLFDGAPHGQ